ncbi:MAG: bifunctional metallophosphatase/5'-nucleotidase [Bacteroidales bacterium]|nr:bifunctional metallophosphatase/5'-nucleotidase [Bacteroidales bacterium]
MSKKLTFFFTTIGFLFLINGIAQTQADKKQIEVIILHTNDMHAKIDNLSKLAYLADSLRATHPHVYLVAAGDNFTGNPVVDMVDDKGYPMIDLMNRCKFDVSCIGNHEFDLGQDFLTKRINQAKFPFICCNLDATGTRLQQPLPYTVLYVDEKNTIALLGIIQLDANGLPSTHPSKMTGISFSNGIESAREFTWLKDRYGILIGLTHLGVEEDVRLADSMPQFDVIMGGHSHTLIEKPMFRNGVMIVQAGSNLKYIGKTTLLIEDQHVVQRTDEIIPVKMLTSSNKELDKLISKYNKNTEFSKVVGVATNPLDGEDELGSMMTDALIHELKVDMAFQNKGGIRVQSLPKGDITMKDLYKLDPFNNQVVIFRMNPAEIRSLICYGYQLEKEIDLQVSRITYRLTDNGKKQCKTVELLDNSGKLLDETKNYTVAMNNYMAVAYQFDHRDPGTSTSVTTIEALINYLKTVKTIDYSGVKRAILIP